MAAVLAEGETIMLNCAREPEVADLADLLNKMGAHIEGAGTSTIRVKGVSKLHGAKHRIIPDRIEAGTFIIAGALTGGDLNVAGCDPRHFMALLQKLECDAAQGHFFSEALDVDAAEKLLLDPKPLKKSA